MLVSDKIRTERFVQRLVTLILSKLQSSNFSFGVGQYHGTLLYFGQCVKLQNVSSIGWFSMKFSEPDQSLTNVPHCAVSKNSLLYFSISLSPHLPLWLLLGSSKL